MTTGAVRVALVVSAAAFVLSASSRQTPPVGPLVC